MTTTPTTAGRSPAAAANLIAALAATDRGPSRDWMTDALCHQAIEQGWATHDDFFPEQGHTAANARRVCADCPVRQECADYADAITRRQPNQPSEGVWGGQLRKRPRPAKAGAA